MKPELLLALNTATLSTSISLYDATLRGELLWSSSRNQTTELIPAIQWLLQQQHLTIDLVGAVGVVTGPGSFNGLRVGIATAKGLCMARGIPIVGIGTMEALAHQHRETERTIRPICDAGRNEIATALFRFVAGEVVEIEPRRVTSLEMLAREITEPTLICGELQSGWQRALAAAAGEMVTFPSRAGMALRAGYVAEVCWNRWQSKRLDDVASLQPVYLRRPAITPSRH